MDQQKVRDLFYLVMEYCSDQWSSTGKFPIPWNFTELNPDTEQWRLEAFRLQRAKESKKFFCVTFKINYEKIVVVQAFRNFQLTPDYRIKKTRKGARETGGQLFYSGQFNLSDYKEVSKHLEVIQVALKNFAI